MNSRLLILAVLLYCVSFFQLLRNIKRSGIIRFLYLFWFHMLVGTGYLFLAVYQHWDWGIRYKRFAFIDFTSVTYFYVVLLCLFLLILTRTRYLLSSGQKKQVFFKLKPFSRFDLIVLVLFLFQYLLGLKLGTLSTKPISLPFRLNGIIELSLILLIPIYISLRTINYRRGLWIGFAIITAYAVLNIVSFGSKGPAIYPIVVFITTTIATRPLNIATIAVPMLLIVSLYAVFNPRYFRQSLVSGESISKSEKLMNSMKYAEVSNRRSLLGARNLAVRITGILAMQQAVDDSSPFFIRTRSQRMTLRPNRYYNETIQMSPYGTSDATGHFGCFMFMFHNHVIGFMVGCFVILFFFRISCYFDDVAHRSGLFYPIIQGVFFVLWTLGLMVDGNYDKLSGYLKLVFGVIVVGAMARVLLGEKRIRENRKIEPTEDNYA